MPRGTQDTASPAHPFRLQDYHLLRSAFPCRFGYRYAVVLMRSCNLPTMQAWPGFGLLPFRSPLLRESLLISFPPGTEMFHFPGFASCTYVFSAGWSCITRTGLPHSGIHGSKLARSSPWLFAACHALHRRLMPRHPPYALSILTCSFQDTTDVLSCTFLLSKNIGRMIPPEYITKKQAPFEDP